MSYWDHPRPVKRVRSVDVEDIAREARALLDAGGLPAVTVRALAGRMGVAPASLYSRVRSVDDLLDLALDEALGQDEDLQEASDGNDIGELMLAYYRHLRRHSWAPRVIGMRAPRGPHYLRLSERMCALLADGGAADPLTTAYAMSNFVIGSASTTPIADHERATRVDPGLAPVYARLHATHSVDPEHIVAAGLAALRDVGGHS